MNWEKVTLMVGQLAVLAVLGTLTALGHNDEIHLGLMAACGALVGVGAWQSVTKRLPPPTS